MTTYKTLDLKQDAEIATITLTRPEKRNAISAQMIEDLLEALGEVETGASRVTILTGAGNAFCAGMDIEDLRSIAARSHEQHLEESQRTARMFYRLYRYRQPLIAAVNGPAIAGGCGIATLADFTLSVPAAKFGYTEVKIGFIPALVSVFLRRQTGEKRLRDLLLTGRIITAEEALASGLVTEIVAPEKLLDRAREIANTLIASSPTSLARTKRLLLQFDEKAIEEEIDLAVRENAGIRSTPDFREGVTAFLEKRPPKWHGE